MTPAARDIDKLISYSIGDWMVTDSEEIAILGVIRNDPTPDTTVSDLISSRRLNPLLDRVTNNRRQLIELLGGRVNTSTAASVRSSITRFGSELGWIFDISNELQNRLRSLASVGTGMCVGAPLPVTVSGPSNAPFTGAGATGVDPATLSIPIADQIRLLMGHLATTRLYTNPIPGSLPAYLASLTPNDRLQQAQVLLCQPIISLVPGSYSGSIPGRSEMVMLAAAQYNLDPSTLAAFILAEQRDQSRNEDAKDLIAATSAKKANTSIGLGQVVVSTALRSDLFSDLLSPGTRGRLTHDQIARLLDSDEFNIFAVAKYIRQVANSATVLNIARLPATRSAFPGINMSAFGANSATWPPDNIRALGSEYTSAPWDDSVSPGWGDFVYQAFKDVRSSGVFR